MTGDRPAHPICWILVASTFIFTGCIATGPAFQRVNPIPSGKGVVYVYRSPGGGAPLIYGTVTANNTPIMKIRDGGYFPYIADPGTVHFEVSTEATSEADVTVEAGMEKYLKITIGHDFLVGRLNFTEVSPEIGSTEVKVCKLLKPCQP